MKLTLTETEKIELRRSGSIKVFRTGHTCPISSIIYGTGTYHLFDKVDYCWVYGDAAGYIKEMTNKGMRGTDYPDNSRNINSGAHWYEFENQDQNPYGEPGKLITSGWLNKIQFTISGIHISELRIKGAYKQVIFSIILNIA